MTFKGYLIAVELKSFPGTAAELSKSFVVIVPTDSNLYDVETSATAFEIVADAVLKASGHSVIEETWTRNVLIADLAPFKNSLLIEKDGWKCFAIKN